MSTDVERVHSRGSFQPGTGADLESADTTAVVRRHGTLSAALMRAESMRLWGFLAVATFAFCAVSVALYRFGPQRRTAAEPPARPAAAARSALASPRPPLIVQTGGSTR